MAPEYRFDYGKAKPNRFAADVGNSHPVTVTLDPEIAQVFKDSSVVNRVLRALIQTMPRTAS